MEFERFYRLFNEVIEDRLGKFGKATAFDKDIKELYNRINHPDLLDEGVIAAAEAYHLALYSQPEIMKKISEENRISLRRLEEEIAEMMQG